MQSIHLDFSTLLGGIVHRDRYHEIVELKLQPENDLPPYRHSGAVVLLALTGSAKVMCNSSVQILNPTQMLVIEPNCCHSICATAPDTYIIAIKNLCPGE